MEINNYNSVADLYDIYVPATFDIDFFINETRNAGGEVLELMSGTGRVSIPLLQAGVHLTCVDFSGDLNAILKEKLNELDLKAEVYQADVRDLNLERQFEMVIIPFHSFAHLTTLEDQRKALGRIKQHLNPNGTFICTLSNPTVRQKDVNGQYRLIRRYPLSATGGNLLLWTVEKNHSDDPEVVEAMQFYEEYDSNGVLHSKRVLELHFRLSEKEEFEELLQDAGFKIKSIYGDYSYSEFKEDSPFMIWILENA